MPSFSAVNRRLRYAPRLPKHLAHRRIQQRTCRSPTEERNPGTPTSRRVHRIYCRSARCLALDQRMPVRPTPQIARLVKQHRPAFPLDSRPDASSHSSPSFHTPGSRNPVTPMFRRPRNHGFRHFSRNATPGSVAIARHCTSRHWMLAVVERDFRWRARWQNSRINHVRRIAVEHRAAAEYAVAIVAVRRGRKRHRRMLPVDHVRDSSHAPNASFPRTRRWGCTEKTCGSGPCKNRAVGIVHPVGRREAGGTAAAAGPLPASPANCCVLQAHSQEASTPPKPHTHSAKENYVA